MFPYPVNGGSDRSGNHSRLTTVLSGSCPSTCLDSRTDATDVGIIARFGGIRYLTVVQTQITETGEFWIQGQALLYCKILFEKHTNNIINIQATLSS